MSMSMITNKRFKALIDLIIQGFTFQPEFGKGLNLTIIVIGLVWLHPIKLAILRYFLKSWNLG